MFKKAASLVLSVAVTLGMLISPLPTLAADGDGGTGTVWQDGFYTTTVNTEKETYGWQEKNGEIVYGFSYPKNNYNFPVTVQIQDGRIVDVAYTEDVYSIVANTSSDINYLIWAMDGHNVTDASYNYLAKEGSNYDKYHLDPKPVKNGVGIRDQVIDNQGTEGVDTVTAASITSRAIIKSVQQSLAKAETGAKDDPAPTLPGEDTSADVIPKDGVYMGFGDCIGADLDDERPAVFYVKNGKITADLMLQQRPSSFPYLYAGTEKEALEAGEEGWLIPLNYDYGYRDKNDNIVYGSLYKGVAIKSLDKKIPVVSFAGGSGNWFNRPMTFSFEDLTKIPYGDYVPANFSSEGGSGRVTLSCEKIRVTKKGIFADIKFSSSKYTKAAVDGVEYDPVSTTGGSLFTLPMNLNAETIVSGTTVAMSSPQTIDYTCVVSFDPANLVPIEKEYQDGFYTTEARTNKSVFGWKLDKNGNVQYGYSYPSSDYVLPVTIQIENGQIVDVAYTQDPNSIMANTSSDFNYLLWAMDGHNVTDYSYDYLADGGNYETYHLNPYPAKNGVGMKEQIIAKNGTNDVDTVTSATVTSKAIIDSVDLSLEKAEKGEKDDPAPVLPTPVTTEDIIPDDGEYTAEATCVGAEVGAGTIILNVEGGTITARMGIEQRQKSYPYIFAGTEAEALAAGEDAWLVPEDYDYGYKYPGSMYSDVPIKSLDKPLHFVMYAKGSGNWFNRLITIDSTTLKPLADAQAAAQAVIEQIAALPETIVLTDETVVKAARNAYDALTNVQQSFVTNYATLEAAETKITELKDQAAAQAMIEQIAALPETVTLADEETVAAARKAYEKLSDAAKAQVTNYAVLEAAEATITELKDQAAAQAVIELIAALPETITLADEEAVAAARTAYDALNDAQKALVTNLDNLTAAETTIAEEKEAAEADEKDLSTATVTVKAQTYTGNALKPAVTVEKGGKTLTADKDYSVKYENNTNAGTAKVTVTGVGEYKGTKEATFKINKGKTTFTAKAKTKTVKVKKLKKKAQKVQINVTKLSKGSSKVTYKIKSVSKGQKKKVKVNKKGQVTIKKGAKKCKIVVTVTSKANANRAAYSKNVTIKVK